MHARDTEQKVAAILALLLERDVEPGDDLNMTACPEWTSMKHIEIIMTLEEQLDLRFDAPDIPALTSQKLLAAKADQLLRPLHQETLGE